MSENEYIEREVVRTTIKSLCNKYNVAYGGNSGGFAEDLEKNIINLPSADVEEVIRCKDCKYWGGRYGDNECTMITDLAKPDFWVKTLPEDFCSSAIRKSSEEKMTDNEIIKALECCIIGCYAEGCDDCPLYGKVEDCDIEIPIIALDLINRQKEKIEELEKGELSKAMTFNSDTIKRCSAEAIKEFAEEHKKIMRSFLYNDSTDFLMKWCEYETTTDNLVKEMTEAEK